MEDSDDHMRPRYIAQHLHQVWRAVNFNWPVKGYFHWSLVDNFEWERGWTQRFGLWGLDIDTQKRIRRPSVDFYAEICKENGISSDMVQKYCPEVFDKIVSELDRRPNGAHGEQSLCAVLSKYFELDKLSVW